MNRGFTLVELVVSIAIFVMMTALVVAKYGAFNQSTLLTDTAYDVALALHTAESYGLSVKNNFAASGGNFTAPYGIDFDVDPAGHSCGLTMSNSTNLILFADFDPIGAPDGLCSSGDSAITTYTLTRGAYVSALCVGTVGSCTPVNKLDINFIRPDPEANICYHDQGADTTSCNYSHAEITIKASDGSTRMIAVEHNGQISVLQSLTPASTGH